MVSMVRSRVGKLVMPVEMSSGFNMGGSRSGRLGAPSLPGRESAYFWNSRGRAGPTPRYLPTADPPMPPAKMSVGDLKKACKAKGLPMTGEKSDLESRLETFALGERFKMEDGRNPCVLKAGELKKALAQRGLPCDLSISSRDELLASLVAALQKEGPAQQGDGSEDERPLSERRKGGTSAFASGSSDTGLAVDMAKKVLELGEGGDYEGVLSLVGKSVSRSTPFTDLRKAYLALARLIHPDKLSASFDGATRAFQMLVSSFEALSSPEPTPEESAKAGKRAKPATALARSNANCYRTKIYCPRCGDEWARPDSGVEKYSCARLRCRQRERRALRPPLPAPFRSPPPPPFALHIAWLVQVIAVRAYLGPCPHSRRPMAHLPPCPALSAADTHMMQGLKTFCCAGCLCEFGCVTATHKCPLCTRKLDSYHPLDYHKQIECGSCRRPFGFWLFTVPARVEEALRAEVRPAGGHMPPADVEGPPHAYPHAYTLPPPPTPPCMWSSLSSRGVPWSSPSLGARAGPERTSRPSSQPDPTRPPPQIRASQEAALKAREARLARLHRIQRKAAERGEADQGEAERLKQAEALFVRNLIDACPRCGFEPPVSACDRDSLVAHLHECNDRLAHKQHRKAVAAAEARAGAKAAAVDAQAEATNLAAWQYLGGDQSSMWLLTDKQLQKQCEDKGVDSSGSREEMLCQLAAASTQANKLLTHKASGGHQKAGTAAGPSGSKRGRPRIDRDSLPSNLHSMSLAQLRAVAAANGLVVRDGSTDDVIRQIEAATDDANEPLFLE